MAHATALATSLERIDLYMLVSIVMGCVDVDATKRRGAIAASAE
ncbi:hypothetical protein [Burkholderia sp. Ac-20379]|nr:hypothetical protein [Burkholderia sp. Ac-20379]